MSRWRGSAIQQIKMARELEKALMNTGALRATLNRYVASLNLQGQINRGHITEDQAAQLFKKAIADFSVRLTCEIQKRLVDSRYKIDQDDLSNPLNMQTALNNPNSTASQLMNDAAAALIDECTQQAAQNEENMTHQQVSEKKENYKEQVAIQTLMPAPASGPTHSVKDKEALLAESVLAVAAGKEIAEHDIEKYFDNKIKIKIHIPEVLEKEEEKLESPFKLLLKPKPPMPDKKE